MFDMLWGGKDFKKPPEESTSSSEAEEMPFYHNASEEWICNSCARQNPPNLPVCCFCLVGTKPGSGSEKAMVVCVCVCVCVHKTQLA